VRDVEGLPKKKRQPLIEVGDIDDEIQTSVAETARQDKIVNYVQKNPVDAAKMINLWCVRTIMSSVKLQKRCIQKMAAACKKLAVMNALDVVPPSQGD